MPSPVQRQDHLNVVKIRLESLRPLFSTGIKGEVYCSLFDEFLANREFGLALEVLCDFLLEPEVRSPGEIQLNEIAELHALMEVQDQCFLRLRKKREEFESSNERS